MSTGTLDALKAVYAEVAQVVSPVFAVGGCVRDALLGEPIKDFDFTTPLLPDDVEAAIRAAGRRPYIVGKRFGTVGFRLSGRFIEITTFRAERYEKHNRKPEVVFLEELDGDLSRRDFTINAIAYDGEQLIDPFGGRSDLNQGIIRAVGVADDRLQDDPLRILRAARFAATLGFRVEEELFAAVCIRWPFLAKVSRERWAIELEKFLAGAFVWRGLGILRDSGALQLVLPELAWLDTAQWQQVETDFALRCDIPLDSTTDAFADDGSLSYRNLENQRLILLLLAAAKARGLTIEQAQPVVSEQAQRIAHSLRFSNAQTQDLIRNLMN